MLTGSIRTCVRTQSTKVLAVLSIGTTPARKQYFSPKFRMPVSVPVADADADADGVLIGAECGWGTGGEDQVHSPQEEPIPPSHCPARRCRPGPRIRDLEPGTGDQALGTVTGPSPWPFFGRIVAPWSGHKKKGTRVGPGPLGLLSLADDGALISRVGWPGRPPGGSPSGVLAPGCAPWPAGLAR